MERASPLLFDAVLTPHRSLGPRGFYVLMAVVSLVSFAAGAAFMALGAWPVFGFFGLDVLALYVAFRFSYRSGRLLERVQVDAAELRVARIQPDGRSQAWSFPSYWTRLAVEGEVDGPGRVVLASHGQSVAVGAFLAPEERGDFAQALGAALRQAKTP